MTREDFIIKKMEQDLKAHYAQHAAQPGELDKKWKLLTESVPKLFINDDLTIKRDVIRNFRKWTIFIPDMPIHNRRFHLLKKTISGAQRGAREGLRGLIKLLEDLKLQDLLKQYPCNEVGNPNTFIYKGYRYTERWIRHIIFLSIFKKSLSPRLKDNFILMDIGSSYGIFSYLNKNEFPKSTQILLDFPEQLALAHYYLGMSFPDAKIASYTDLMQAKRLDRSYLSQFDFVLLPWTLYSKVEANTLDVLCNFASLGEMRREWFDYYLKSEPFLSTKYFFCVNRFESSTTYDTDLTVLDYPLLDFKRLYFQISKFFTHTYKRKYLFFYEKFYYPSQYFEFVGERM